ncbi:MAG: hypothetical protein KJ749_12730 [Planctomycetes bacterium]|nr:hypothetical protein [Planctomycetota bacterium]
MIRQLLPIAMASAILAGCCDKQLPSAERWPEKPQKPAPTEPAASVEKRPDIPELPPVPAEQKSMYDLPLVIDFDDLPEVPAQLLGPSPPIVEKE